MKNLKKFIPMLLMLLFIVVLLPNNLNEVQAAKTKLNSTTLSMSKGDTYTLKLKNNKSKIKWSSSNKKIVSVNSSGKLTAKASGTCKIYAKVGSKKYTCNITVTAIELDTSSLEINKGQTYDLKLGIINSANVTWFSTNSSVASIDKNGKITALKGGTSNILAFYNGRLYICSVTVVTDMIVLFSNDDLTIYLYKIVPFTDYKYNTKMYYRIKNKMKSSITVHTESIAINNEGSPDFWQHDYISPNSTLTSSFEAYFDESFVNINNLELKQISSSFYYYINSTETMVDKDFDVNIN